MTVHNPYDDTILLAFIAIMQLDVDEILEDTDAIREVTDAEPILEETGGTLTTDGTEQNIYINNAPAGIYKPTWFNINFTLPGSYDTFNNFRKSHFFKFFF